MKPPSGLSESEEADWWFDHRDDLAVEFELAAKEGRLQRRAPGWMEREAEGRKLAVELGLSQDEANRASALARRRSVPLKEYLLSLVHQGIVRDSSGSGEQDSAAA